MRFRVEERRRSSRHGRDEDDAIKRTIASVPWSNAATTIVNDDGSTDEIHPSTQPNAYLEGAVRAEKAAESGNRRASSVACAKQTEVVALGKRVGAMLGFESETDGFTDPSDFIDVEIKSKRQLEKERKEREAEEEEEEEEEEDGDDDDDSFFFSRRRHIRRPSLEYYYYLRTTKKRLL